MDGLQFVLQKLQTKIKVGLKPLVAEYAFTPRAKAEGYS